MSKPSIEHTHTDLPVERIVVEFNPNTARLSYRFENTDYYRASGHLHAAALLALMDMKKEVKDG